jgi:hypothetical protein
MMLSAYVKGNRLSALVKMPSELYTPHILIPNSAENFVRVEP